MEAKKVIVVGATGTLGSKIVAELIKQGAEVTALVRKTSNRSKLEKVGVMNFAVADMMDKISLKDVLRPGKFDAIVTSAAGYTRNTKGDTPKTDTIGYQNLADATKEARIPRFVMISILECDKADSVPHFRNKYQIEKYLEKIGQPYIAIRPGAFLDQNPDYILPKIAKGIVPSFFTGVDYGTIYTPDLARYTAMAAISLPDSELNSHIDVGWSEPVNDKKLAMAFSKVLNQPLKAEPVVPPFVLNLVLPFVGLFNGNLSDMIKMVKWVEKGDYISHDTMKQKRVFGDLPGIEEGVRRYCEDHKLIKPKVKA